MKLKKKLNEIRLIVSQYIFTFKGTKSRITISVGVAKADLNNSFSDTFKRADKALYKAKHNGRNRVVLD